MDKERYDLKTANKQAINQVISIVESFEVEVKSIATTENAFKCFWKSNSFHFNLQTIIASELAGEFLIDSIEPCLCVLLLQDKTVEVLEVIETFNIKNVYLLIYDEDEDIQVFAKDLWNLLVALNNR